MATRKTKDTSVLPVVQLPVNQIITAAAFNRALATAIQSMTTDYDEDFDQINMDVPVPTFGKRFWLGARDISSSSDSMELYYYAKDYRRSLCIVQFAPPLGYKLLVYTQESQRVGHFTISEVVRLLNAFFVHPLFRDTEFIEYRETLCYKTKNGLLPTRVFNKTHGDTFTLHKSFPGPVDDPARAPIHGRPVPERRRWNTRTIATAAAEEPIMAPHRLSTVINSTILAPSLEAAFNPDTEIAGVNP